MKFSSLVDVIDEIREAKKVGGVIDLMEVMSDDLVESLGEKWMKNFAYLQYYNIPNGDNITYINIGEEVTYIHLLEQVNVNPLTSMNKILMEIMRDGKFILPIGASGMVCDGSNFDYSQLNIPITQYVNYGHFNLGYSNDETKQIVNDAYKRSFESIVNYLLYGGKVVEYEYQYGPVDMKGPLNPSAL